MVLCEFLKFFTNTFDILAKTIMLNQGSTVMVLLGLLGDVHKGNSTWNLKAFDEFQSLLLFAGQN